jgi:hypothetical protein
VGVPLRNGDVVLVKSLPGALTSLSIRLGEWRHYGVSSPHAQWTHCAMVYDVSNQDAIVIIEATGRGGVHTVFLDKYAARAEVVHTQVDGKDWDEVKRFLDSVLAERESYGWVTWFGLLLYDLTGTQVCLQRAGTLICSGLVCDALTRAGFVWRRPPFACTPADIDADLGALTSPAPARTPALDYVPALAAALAAKPRRSLRAIDRARRRRAIRRMRTLHTRAARVP